jgi:hypothetical protein
MPPKAAQPKPSKTHTFTLPAGQKFTVNATYWKRTCEHYQYTFGFKALRLIPLREGMRPLPPDTPEPTPDEQTQGALYYFFGNCSPLYATACRTGMNEQSFRQKN